MSNEDEKSNPSLPPLPPAGELPPPPPMPSTGDLPPPPPMPDLAGMPPPPAPASVPAPPPMPEMPTPPPMPEMPAPTPAPELTPAPSADITPVTMAEDSHDVHEAPVDLPDPLSALDILSAPTTEPVDAVEEVEEPEPDNELSVADYKWKDSVLDAIIDKFEINDRDAFLVHATAFDSNNNLYLTKNELTAAAKEWVEIRVPEVSDEEPEPAVVSESISDEEDVAEPIVEEPTAPVVLELPPLPAPTRPEVIEQPPMPAPEPLELPPLPAPSPELPPLPTPEPLELPPQPAPSPELPPLPTPVNENPIEEVVAVEETAASPVDTDDYRELWKRRSDKSLPQMYGAIDRIGSGEIGSLLDRYSDRFGHELDREIIVMRRAEQDARREAVPVVELISAPEEDDDEDSLQSQLSEVEDLLRPLQKEYKSAESNAEKKRLAPALKALIAERKILLGVISGELDESELDEIPERPDIPGQEDVDDESDDVEEVDQFTEFFGVINNLLGDMPEDWVNNFLESKGFALFQKVGEDPGAANTKTRKKFFVMINDELGSMPEDMLDEFVSSPDFELYKLMGEMYGE